MSALAQTRCLRPVAGRQQRPLQLQASGAPRLPQQPLPAQRSCIASRVKSALLASVVVPILLLSSPAFAIQVDEVRPLSGLWLIGRLHAAILRMKGTIGSADTAPFRRVLYFYSNVKRNVWQCAQKW